MLVFFAPKLYVCRHNCGPEISGAKVLPPLSPSTFCIRIKEDGPWEETKQSASCCRLLLLSMMGFFVMLSWSSVVTETARSWNNEGRKGRRNLNVIFNEKPSFRHLTKNLSNRIQHMECIRCISESKLSFRIVETEVLLSRFTRWTLHFRFRALSILLFQRKVDAKLQTAVVSTPIWPVSPSLGFDSRSLYACVLLIKPETIFFITSAPLSSFTSFTSFTPFTCIYILHIFCIVLSRHHIAMKWSFAKGGERTGVTFITGNMPPRKSQSLGLQLHCWSRAHWLKRWILHSSQF